MIEVFAHRKGGYYRLYITGHANYQPGNDVVCAGVSALSGALASFAAENPHCRHLRCNLGKGELFLSCRGGLGNAWNAIIKGLCAIAESYPLHVQIKSLESVDDK